MRYHSPVIAADATPEQLTTALVCLCVLQRKAVIPSTAAEIGVDIDLLIDRLSEAT